MAKKTEQSELEESIEYIRETLDRIKSGVDSEEVSGIGEELDLLAKKIAGRHGGIILGRPCRLGLHNEIKKTIRRFPYGEVFSISDLSAVVSGEEKNDKSIQVFMRNLWNKEKASLDLARFELFMKGHRLTYYMKPKEDYTEHSKKRSTQILDYLPKKFVTQFGEDVVSRGVDDIFSIVNGEGYVSCSYGPIGRAELEPILSFLTKSNVFEVGTFLKTKQPAIAYSPRRLRERQGLLLK